MRDIHGLTPVHIAAASENAHALRALLSLDPHRIAEDLKEQGRYNPSRRIGDLDALVKESMETLVGVWRGYSDDALSCEKGDGGCQWWLPEKESILRGGGLGVRVGCARMGGCRPG
jgi:ankyrin repeat protein